MDNLLITMWITAKSGSKMWITLLFMSFFMVFHQDSDAQILPPDFVCVNSDTLIWNYTNNSCGSFEGYVIYSSNNINGPYSELTTITALAQTFYYDPNPTNETRYYYLQSDFNCPGQTAINSDTLDNLIPNVVEIDRVSVASNAVIIDWFPSSSSQTSDYIIYRETSQGTIPIDTVPASQLSYQDDNANPESGPVQYYVLAADACGTSSIFNPPHQTIYLTGFVEDCNPDIMLNWNTYTNWPDGIDYQEIWVSENGGNEAFVDSIFAQSSDYAFTNGNDGNEYCFRVIAYKNNSVVRSFSSQFCILLDIVQPVRELMIYNVSYEENNDCTVHWVWNDNAEILSREFVRFDENSQPDQTFSDNITAPLEYVNQFPDNSNAVPNLRSYQLSTIDNCNTEVQSNVASPIYLQGSPGTNKVNNLNWSPLEIEGNLTIKEYLIYRIVDGDTEFLTSISFGEDLSYQNQVDPEDKDQTSVCYFVIGVSDIELPNGNIIEIKSRSNTVCIEQVAQIYVPNAFVPDGKNKEFRPAVVFGSTSDYSMVIYDRWGTKIFETSDINTGWNGKKDGKELEQGVYVYVIQLQQLSGKAIEEKGTVLLLR